MIKNYYPKTEYMQYIHMLFNKFFRPFKDSSIQLSWIHQNQLQKNLDQELLKTAIDIIIKTPNINLSDLYSRQKEGKNWLSVFPGEHYNLLASAVQILNPKIVIEIGTHLGHASLTLKKHVSEDSKVYTFDVFNWYQFSDTCFFESDFDHQLEQLVVDLTVYENCIKYRDVIQNADLIFIDALKDGKQEYLFLENFKKIGLKDSCYLIFDDIRVQNMIKFWNELDMPKIDLTSFGHWSGTGLVKWKK
jgi:predicted O-methyltransferase YrrM